jgi:probable F420-dependent oxidoreductase
MAVSTPQERAFRFGVVAAAARGGEEWAGLARRIEGLGYSTLLCPDTTGTLPPFAALAAAAAVTRTLRLGTYVLASPLRTPAAVAWEAAGLDRLSDGRLELGLGAGRPDSEQDAARLGLPFGSAGERVSRLEQTLDAVRDRFAAAAAAASATPPGPRRDAVYGVQQPLPPVLVAGSGPRMLRLAAQRADILALGLPPTSTEDDLVAKTRELREIAGEGFGRLELNLNLALIGEDFPPHAKAWLGRDPAELLRSGSVTVLTGTPREMADKLLRRRERTGVSYVSVNGMFAEALAPVVELLADD